MKYLVIIRVNFCEFCIKNVVTPHLNRLDSKYDELLTIVKKRKLRWFGHISRSSGLAKTILQGTVQGKRRKGRQKMRWEDTIWEWTGMDFASSTRAAEDRTSCPSDDLARL